MPFKINMLHYMAHTNNSEALQQALISEAEYVEDCFKKSPLDYSIERKSHLCT